MKDGMKTFFYNQVDKLVMLHRQTTSCHLTIFEGQADIAFYDRERKDEDGRSVVELAAKIAYHSPFRGLGPSVDFEIYIIDDVFIQPYSQRFHPEDQWWAQIEAMAAKYCKSSEGENDA